MIFSRLHISHDLSKAQRRVGLEFVSTGLVDASLPVCLGTVTLWAFQGLKNSYFGLCHDLMEALPPCLEPGEGQARACAPHPAELC